MTKLTTDEFNTAFNAAVKAFANKSEAEVLSEIYGIRKGTSTDRAWIYLYALNTWDNTDVDNNYMTESQMVKIISKVQQNA